MTNSRPSPESTTRPPAGLADVARTLRRRAIDLLAIAVVLIGGLAVGRELVAWWHDDPAFDSTPASATIATAGTDAAWTAPTRLVLGESGQVIERTELTGDREGMMAEMLDHAADLARGYHPQASPVDAAERRLLDRLLDGRPAILADDGIELYRLDGGLPMAVAVTGPETGRRIAAWGLAVPLADDHWICWCTRRRPVSSVEESGGLLPPGCRPLLTLGTGGTQNRLSVFEGPGDPGDWLAPFQSRLRASGLEPVGTAVKHPDGWTGRFANSDGVVAVVSIYRDGPGRSRGLLNQFETRTRPPAR